MNWYGGSLHRHSKPTERFGNRNYISSARRFNHVPPSDDFSLSNFVPTYLRPGESADAGRISKRQRTLEEFPKLAPLVHRLESIGNPVKRSSSRSRDPRLAHGRRREDKSYKNGSSSIHPIVIEDKEANSDSDIENPTNSANKLPYHHASSTEEKRLKLLNQQDWAGLKHTRPVHIDFSKRKQRPRQRPIPVREEHAQYEEDFNAREPLKRQNTEHSDGSEVYMTGALRVDNPSINVKIGKDALQSTLASEPADEQKACHNHRATSNELMLLENQEFCNEPAQIPKTAQEMLFDEYILPTSQLPTLRSSIWRRADSPESDKSMNPREYAPRNEQDDPQHNRSIQHDTAIQSSTNCRPTAEKTPPILTGYGTRKDLARNPTAHPFAYAYSTLPCNVEKGRLAAIPRFDIVENDSAPRIRLLSSNRHAAATDALTQDHPMVVVDLAAQLGGLNPTKVSNGLMQNAQCIAQRSNDQFDADEGVDPIMPWTEGGVIGSQISTPSSLDEIERLAARPAVPMIAELKDDDDEDAIWQCFVFGDSRPSTVSARGSNLATSVENNQGTSSDSANLTGLSTKVHPDTDIVPSSSQPYGPSQVKHTLTSIMPTHQLGLKVAI